MYAVQADIEAYFGRQNVRKWADLDNSRDDTIIAARIVLAAANATAEIDADLRGGPLAIPITLSPTPTIIVRICAYLAGDELYNARRIENQAETEVELPLVSSARREAENLMARIMAGELRLAAVETITTLPGLEDSAVARRTIHGDHPHIGL